MVTVSWTSVILIVLAAPLGTTTVTSAFQTASTKPDFWLPLRLCSNHNLLQSDVTTIERTRGSTTTCLFGKSSAENEVLQKALGSVRNETAPESSIPLKVKAEAEDGAKKVPHEKKREELESRKISTASERRPKMLEGERNDVFEMESDDVQAQRAVTAGIRFQEEEARKAAAKQRIEELKLQVNNSRQEESKKAVTKKAQKECEAQKMSATELTEEESKFSVEVKRDGGDKMKAVAKPKTMELELKVEVRCQSGEAKNTFSKGKQMEDESKTITVQKERRDSKELKLQKEEAITVAAEQKQQEMKSPKASAEEKHQELEVDIFGTVEKATLSLRATEDALKGNKKGTERGKRKNESDVEKLYVVSSKGKLEDQVKSFPGEVQNAVNETAGEGNMKSIPADKTVEEIKSVAGRVTDPEKPKRVPDKIQGASVGKVNEVGEDFKIIPERVVRAAQRVVDEAVDDTKKRVEATVEDAVGNLLEGARAAAVERKRKRKEKQLQEIAAEAEARRKEEEIEQNAARGEKSNELKQIDEGETEKPVGEQISKEFKEVRKRDVSAAEGKPTGVAEQKRKGLETQSVPFFAATERKVVTDNKTNELGEQTEEKIEGTKTTANKKQEEVETTQAVSAAGDWQYDISKIPAAPQEPPPPLPKSPGDNVVDGIVNDNEYPPKSVPLKPPAEVLFFSSVYKKQAATLEQKVQKDQNDEKKDLEPEAGKIVAEPSQMKLEVQKVQRNVDTKEGGDSTSERKEWKSGTDLEMKEKGKTTDLEKSENEGKRAFVVEEQKQPMELKTQNITSLAEARRLQGKARRAFAKLKRKELVVHYAAATAATAAAAASKGFRWEEEETKATTSEEVTQMEAFILEEEARKATARQKRKELEFQKATAAKERLRQLEARNAVSKQKRKELVKHYTAAAGGGERR